MDLAFAKHLISTQWRVGVHLFNARMTNAISLDLLRPRQRCPFHQHSVKLRLLAEMAIWKVKGKLQLFYCPLLSDKESPQKIVNGFFSIYCQSTFHYFRITRQTSAEMNFSIETFSYSWFGYVCVNIRMTLKSKNIHI